MTTQQAQVTRRAVPTSIATVLVATVLVAGAFGIGILTGRALTSVDATGAVQLGVATGPIIQGSTRGGIQYTGIPYQAPDARPAVRTGPIIPGSTRGGIQYTGIPYQAPVTFSISGVPWAACLAMGEGSSSFEAYCIPSALAARPVVAQQACEAMSDEAYATWCGADLER